MGHNHSHFSNKKPLEHVAEKLAQGKLDSAEIHGREMPGFIFSGTDAARETALFLLIVSTALSCVRIVNGQLLLILSILAFGWGIWKVGRSAWLGWSRLERLHRVVRQEKWEIDNNREQERRELKELYAAKGFEGKLLDDVIEVLMADDDRLLQVMVEEELGLTLESHDHPLKQALGAFWGVVISTLIILIFYKINPYYGIFIGAMTSLSAASLLSAHYENNKIIPSIVWNVGIAILSYSFVYFVCQFLGK